MASGPLASMVPVFIDVETTYTPDINLNRMTLRQYLDQANILSMAIAIGRGDVAYIATNEDGSLKPEDEGVVEMLKLLATNPNYVFCAHNAAFDIRVLRFKLDIPQPVNVWCSMEGAMAAWPELPDGYSLDNIAAKLKFPEHLRKIEVDLETIKGAELEEYNKQDVRVMQEIYYREIERIPDVEQGVGLRTHRQRKFHFIVDQEKLDKLVEYLNTEAVAAEKLAQEHLTQEDSENVFNHSDGRLSSVRSLRLRSILKDKFGADWKTTSVKKLSPVLMAANPTAAAVVTQVGRVNRMLSHHRRAKIFGQIDEVDVELGYFRAHTGRFSSPSSGKGLNLHNCLRKGTLVLTKAGLKPIETITPFDEVWDGEEFVRSAGATYEGQRECLPSLCSAEATAEHPIWTGKEMVVREALSLPDEANAAIVGFRSLIRGALLSNSSDDTALSMLIPRMEKVLAMAEARDLDDPTLLEARSVVSMLSRATKTILANLYTFESTLTYPEDAVFDVRGVGIRARFQAGGLLCGNCPKHDKSIAKPIREMFHLPKELCFVRADLSNVEYRVLGKLSCCKTVIDMFTPEAGGNIFNDPYCQAWKSMTGQKITKKDPIRQVAKAAVLALGFSMGPVGYAKVLLTALADKKSGVTEPVLIKIAAELDWATPPQNATNRIITAIGCSYTVAKASYYIHKKFNEAHPEFSMTADWLVSNVEAVARSADRSKALDSIEQLQESTKAPPLDMVQLFIDNETDFDSPSIRVKCGPWVPTVCWREPKMRHMFSQFDGISAPRLTIRKASGPAFKAFTRQLAIENVTQAAARNMLCWGVAELERLGFPDVLHVHDEILIIVPRNREAVLAARDAMIRVFGPQGSSPLGWATLVKPDEISVTESMWEDELDITKPFVDPKTGETKGGDRWGKIERNEPGCLEGLP